MPEVVSSFRRYGCSFVHVSVSGMKGGGGRLKGVKKYSLAERMPRKETTLLIRFVVFLTIQFMLGFFASNEIL